MSTSSLRLLTLAPILALTGCLTADLGGSWEGSMSCDDGPEIDVEMDLDADGGGSFSGEFLFLSFQQVVEDGVTYDIELEIEYEIEIETEGPGEQELDGEVELSEVSCRLYADGDLVTDSCADMGLDESELEDAGRVGDMEWDGEDTIEIDDGDCEGELER